jgi:MFS family permease
VADGTPSRPGKVRADPPVATRMTPERIIRTYLTVTALFTLSASLIWGINTLFLLDAGLDIFEVFVANAVFTAAMALFEVPTGVVADTRGRRLSFLLSEATLLVGTLAYVGVAEIGGGLILFSLASVILGLGYTFYSGAVEAWVVDALRAAGYREDLDRVFARASIIAGVATLVGTVGGCWAAWTSRSPSWSGRSWWRWPSELVSPACTTWDSPRGP